MLPELDEFSRTLYQISLNLESLHASTLLLGGPNDSHDLRAEINSITEITKGMIAKAGNDLKALHEIELESDELERVNKLTSEFQRILGQFQEIQQFSINKCKEFVEKAETITTNPDLAPPGQDNINMQGLQNEISYNRLLIQEREQGIQEIEDIMTEVNEIFCDLALLVSDQQQHIDNIELNLEASAARSRAAAREILQARNYQRRRSNYTCMIFLAIFVLIMIVGFLNSIF